MEPLNPKDKKIHSLMGLAARGRNLVSGETQTLDAIRGGAGLLVIVAKDASDNTRKMFHDKCSFYEVPIVEYGTRESLGAAIGQEFRSSLAIVEPGFADKLRSMIEE